MTEIEQRLARIEELAATYASQQMADHGLFVQLVRVHPRRADLLAAFHEREERFMALALNSALPADRWLQHRQVATEALVAECGGLDSGPAPT